MYAQEKSYIGPRQVRPLNMSAQDVADFGALSGIGITITESQVNRMVQAMAMDDQQGGITSPSITTPIQFLQNWLPGFVRNITAARKIDDLVGITTVGSWEDEEVVQGMLEVIGDAVPYGDFTNVPLSSWNTNFERRTIVRFEKGMKIGLLEEARASKIKISTSAEKRSAAALALEIQRNTLGFFGYNNGTNRTYGFLNDPSLPAYQTVAAGVAGSTQWASKVFLEITADLRTLLQLLQTQSMDTINPEDTNITLALSTDCYQYLTVVSDFGISVKDWLTRNYPKIRIVTAPHLNNANGGLNVLYLYAEGVEDGGTDDKRTFTQIVPAKFQALGVEKQSKAYVEDYSNATAGVLLKRPYAVVRATGV